jgi:chemotaxis protein CheD
MQAALTYVKPGEVHWADTPTIFKTVLGSCVSVCLWDQLEAIGGLNHFILPTARSGERDDRYGDVAIPRLIGALRALGCVHLVAKVFGGAAVLPMGGVATVGDANTALALRLLAEHGIPVLAQRTGGRCGVVIRYHSGSGDVLLRQIVGTESQAPVA